MIVRFKGCLIAAVLSGLVSGLFFYGVARDRVTLKYEKILSQVEKEAVDTLAERERELLELSELRVEAAVSLEQKRKPKRQEVIKYVYKNKPADGCAIDDAGMQLIADYIDVSF